MWMNGGDIDEAVKRYQGGIKGRAARVLQAWRDVVDANSDGWSSWPGGARAAKQLMELIECANPTDVQLRRAFGPIKSCCTRKNLPLPEGIL